MFHTCLACRFFLLVVGIYRWNVLISFFSFYTFPLFLRVSLIDFISWNRLMPSKNNCLFSTLFKMMLRKKRKKMMMMIRKMLPNYYSLLISQLYTCLVIDIGIVSAEIKSTFLSTLILIMQRCSKRWWWWWDCHYILKPLFPLLFFFPLPLPLQRDGEIEEIKER